ncbi:MAG: alpha/beta hydrolase [Myxococcales bacterium]|nr:alpha/beta hydrolase [Myxococcales bacterium]
MQHLIERAVAALNGVIGDTLAEQQSPLALKMALVGDGGAAACDDDGALVGDSEAAGRERLCLFVHGNCDCDRTWWQRDVAYGARLREELGVAPLYLRYNSGLHISTNGQQLSALLEAVARSHGALSELTLVGHSMGGLVIRSACYYATLHGLTWVERVRRVVFLGVPHDGAHLERLGRLATLVLSLVPNLTTRVIALSGERRSAGIKDLRHGYLLDEEWAGGGDERLLPSARQHVPLLDGVDYYAGLATLGADEAHWLARLFGDGAVHPASARGDRWLGRGLELPSDNVRVFPKTSHLGLVYSEPVYEQLRSWMS